MISFGLKGLSDDICIASVRFDDSTNVESTLSRGEQALAQSMGAFRAHTAAGRAAAHAALSKLLANDDARTRIDILRDEHRAPIWPQGIVGSISHTLGLAIACVAKASDYRGIGIDTERRARTLKSFNPRLFTSDKERDWLSSSSTTLASAEVLLLSAKECVYKAVYQCTGERLGFHAAELSCVENTKERVCFEATIDSRAVKKMRLLSQPLGDYFVTTTAVTL